MSEPNVSVNLAIAVGAIEAVVAGERADYLIVRDDSNPNYPQKVACEFYSANAKKLLEGLEPGMVVRVSGETRSREYNGKWFTTFHAYKLARMGEAGKWGQEKAPPVDIPF